jgi:hypothetical protein
MSVPFNHRSGVFVRLLLDLRVSRPQRSRGSGYTLSWRGVAGVSCRRPHRADSGRSPAVPAVGCGSSAPHWLDTLHPRSLIPEVTPNAHDARVRAEMHVPLVPVNVDNGRTCAGDACWKVARANGPVCDDRL